MNRLVDMDLVVIVVVLGAVGVKQGGSVIVRQLVVACEGGALWHCQHVHPLCLFSAWRVLLSTHTPRVFLVYAFVEITQLNVWPNEKGMCVCVFMGNQCVIAAAMEH